ncbi:MAG: hypothetical protein LBJ01_03245 [Tannerella sp.]|jgi:myosin heavy subunit|nr:hypothetical protein [Tannerella sp.]
MADNTDKKVLIDVSVEATKALKSYAELKIKVDDLKASQAGLKTEMSKIDVSTKEGAEYREQLRVEYESLGQQIKSYNKDAQAQETIIQKNIQLQEAHEGSINKLRRQLELATVAWTKMEGSADAGTDELKAQQQVVAALKERLNEAEHAYGTFTGQVGNYAIAGKSLRSEMKELVEQLTRMKLAGEDSSEAFKAMTAHLAELRDAFGDVSQGANQLASDTNQLDASTQIVSVAASAFTGLQAMIAANTDASDEYLEVMKNMQVALTALTVLTTVQNSIQKQTIAYRLAEQLLQKIGINQTLRQAAAEAALNKVKMSGSIVTKAVAAAQWLWNAALAANPVILIAMAVVALIAGVTALIKVFDSSARAEKESAKASEAYEAQQRKTAAAVAQVNDAEKNAVNERNNRLREEILEMEKNGASAERIAKARAAAEQELRDISVKASRERVKQQQEEQRAMERSLESAQKVLAGYLKKKGEQSEKYREQKKVVDDLIRSLDTLKQAQIDEAQAQIDAALKSAEAEQQAAGEQQKRYRDNAQKSLETQKKLRDEQNKLTETGMSQDFLVRQKWEEKKFIQSQEYEKRRLEMQKKFGQITRAEYDAQYAILNAQFDTFQQSQLKGMQDYYGQQRQTIASMFDQSIDAQIKAIDEKYKKVAEEFQRLAAVPKPERIAGQSGEDYDKELEKWQKFILDKTSFEMDIERQAAKEREEVRMSGLSKILSDMEARTDRAYDDELAKFTDNERERDPAVKKSRIAKIAGRGEDCPAGLRPGDIRG